MKKLATLLAAGTLLATASRAQTITIDGTLSAGEIGASGYQLVGRYTGNHSFGNAGLLSLYAGADANNVYLFLAGTLETDGGNGTVRNSLQIYLGRPGVSTGVATGVALPKPAAATPYTSFTNVISKNDFPVDCAIGVKGTNTAAQAQFDAIVYTGGPTPTAVSQALNTSLNVTTGAPATLSGTGAYALFNNAVASFRNSANLSANPGSSTNGGAGSSGLEVSIPRSSLGVGSTGGNLYVFALQNNADGDFFSSDILPQNTGPAPGADANGSLQRGPDFTLIPGLQYAVLRLTGTGGTLGSQAAGAAAAFGAYPSPVAAGTPLRVQLAQPASAGTYTLRTVLGQLLLSGRLDGAAASVPTTGLPAGTYLLSVAPEGQPAATSRVQVQ